MKFIGLMLASSAVQTIGWALLHSLWQGIVLAALLGITMSLLRKRTANLRYLIACGTLSLMLILPVSTALWSGAKTQNNDYDKKTFQTEMPRESAAPMNSTEPDNVTRTEELRYSRLEQTVNQFLPWFVLVWTLGVFISSLRLLGVWTYTQRLKRNTNGRILEQWQESLQRLSHQFRILRPIVLLESSLVKVPTVIGWLKPIILLPPSALTGLTPQQLELILAHELAHICRYDYLVNLLQTIIETLLFYHPAVWWVSRQIRNERENACDDLAVTVGGNAVIYARALTQMERLRKTAPSLAMAADGGSLTSRVHRLIGVDLPQSKRLAGLWTVMFIGTFLVAVGVNTQISSLANSIPKDTVRGNFQTDNSELAEKLKSSDSSERAVVICSLGKKKDVSAMPLLIQSLSDDEAVAAPIGCWNSGDWSPLLKTFKQPSPGEEAAIALASFGEIAVEPLVAALKDSNPIVRRNAAWAIGEIRDGDKINRSIALEPLVSALSDEDSWVRRAAAFALDEIKDSRTATALINALSDETAGVREMAANALGEMKEPSAFNSLQAALSDKDERVRSRARWSLAEIQDR